MDAKTEILLPGGTYHIYNRANGNEKLFVSDDNYLFFLNRYQKYLNRFLDTFCYCLMPNHFHLLVRVKEFDEIEQPDLRDLTGFQNLSGLSDAEKETHLSDLISKQFSNCFNSYSKAFNKQQGRKGNLFMRPYKRKKVEDEAYFRKLAHYIHYNPIAAGLTKDFSWRYSSYQALVSAQNTQLCREEIIALFNDLENFKYTHSVAPKISGIEEW